MLDSGARTDPTNGGQSMRFGSRAPGGGLPPSAVGAAWAERATLPLHALRNPAPAKPESTVRIGLRSMDVVLSLSAHAPGPDAEALDFPMPAPFDALSADPVMQRLFDQLGRAGSHPGEEDGVYADTIRLALAARWLSLRTCGQAQPAEALQKWRLQRTIAYVDAHLGEAISLADLARSAGLSRMYFAARFRAATGLRPHDYILRRRIERARELLLQSGQTLVEIALDVGFQTQAHFTTVFKRLVGTTPGRWRALNHQAG